MRPFSITHHNKPTVTIACRSIEFRQSDVMIQNGILITTWNGTAIFLSEYDRAWPRFKHKTQQGTKVIQRRTICKEKCLSNRWLAHIATEIIAI